MAEYSVRNSGKLVLKGEKKTKHKKKSSNKRKLDEEKSVDYQKEDEQRHGGAWSVESIDEIIGSVCIEIGDQMYIHGLDNGLFVLGAAHSNEQPPNDEEILTAIKIDDKHVALKSGYGKYLSVNTAGLLIGRSEAISLREYFEVEIDYDYDGRKMYIKACNDGYLGVNPDGDIVATANKKSESQLVIRSLNKRGSHKKSTSVFKTDEDEVLDDNLRNVELNYVKKFQKFEDKRILLSKDDVKELDEAKSSGVLHEKLLDRREKMKSDRYCK
jgi:protein FRG1